MTFIKEIETLNRFLFYSIFKILFRNQPVPIPLEKEKIKKILIFRYDKIGDMIVTIPGFHYYRELFPNAEIHVVASPKNKMILKYDRVVDKVFTYDGKFTSTLKLLKAARKEKYDCIFNLVFNKTTKAGILANLISKDRNTSKITILHDKRQKLYSSLFNIQVPVKRSALLMAEIILNIFSSVFGSGYDIQKICKKIQYSEAEDNAAEDFISKLPKKDFILFNVSSGSQNRLMSPQNTIEIITEIIKKYPELFFVLHYSPEDIINFQSIASNFKNNLENFPVTDNILEVCSLVARSKMVISPDTSIVHMAAAFDRPVLVFYLSNDNSKDEWRPLNVSFREVISSTGQSLNEIKLKEIINKFENLYENRF